MPILGVIASGISGHLIAPAYDSIQTVTASGGETSLSFSSIPSTYKHLQIRCITSDASNAVVVMQYNNDTGANYSWHSMYGNGGSAGAAQGSSANYMYFLFSSVVASVYGASVVDILDYASTAKYKTLRSLSGSDENGSGNLTIHSGLWQSTSAINAIKIFPEAGNFRQYTQFALYGIRG